MLKCESEIFLDTDVFHEMLKLKEVTFLSHCRKLYKEIFTSVVNCSEIFSQCGNKDEIKAAKDMFEGIGILGIPFRYSEAIGNVMKAIEDKGTGNTYRDALVIAIAAETKLPVVTSDTKKYESISKIFNVNLINKEIIITSDLPGSAI